MYHFTIPMALMDFVPVIFFGITSVVLLRDLQRLLGKVAYILLTAGSVNVFLAGFFKALWKLLYAANICDFKALEEMFLPVNSLGLLMVGLSMICLLMPKKRAALAVAPPVFSGSVAFILMMVIGLGGLCATLSVIAVRLKKKSAVVLFILSFLAAMGMGAMSSQDATQSWVNWVEQSINTVSQLCLMLGVLILHKNGLAEKA